MNNDKTNEKLTEGKNRNNRRRPYYNKKKHRKGNGSPEHNTAAAEVTENPIKANVADEGEETLLSSIAFEDDMTPSVTVSI